MSLSRQEVNLRRLLAKCELMVKNNQRDDVRFPKYVESLTNMIAELETITDFETASPYKPRIKNLQRLFEKEDQCEMSKVNGLTEDPKSAREELLGTDHLRQRNIKSGEDLNDLLHHHNSMQEKITNDMLILTRNLKEQSSLANKIIKQDTSTVSKSTIIAEKNLGKIQVESEKLAEHSRRACKCWMWIILAIVMIVFINMVLFMKMMKKRL